MNLGKIIPKLILTTAIVNGAMRFLPAGLYGYRAWEPMAIGPKTLGTFRPDAEYRNDHAYGDLAAFANLPHLREPRPENFTTDACGNRNVPSVTSGPIDTILAGTSYTLGSGVDDNQTLSEQLRKRQIAAYNAGGVAIDHAEWVMAMASRLKMSSGVVVWEYLERNGTYPEDLTGEEWLKKHPDPCFAPFGKKLEGWASRLKKVSPLEIYVTHAIKRLQNGTILPNPYLGSVERYELKNGEEMLFYPAGVSQALRARPEEAPAAAAKFASISAKLARKNFTLIVMLIPEKYRVYHPHLRNAPFEKTPSSPTHLSLVQAALEARGVPTVNLEPRYVELASSGLAQGKLLFWKDDTHWNARGIEVAAELVAAKIQEVRAKKQIDTPPAVQPLAR